MMEMNSRVRIKGARKTGVIVDENMNTAKKVFIVEDDDPDDDGYYQLYDCLEEELEEI